MRIVGGSHRGRRLAAPADRSLRPSSDRLREGLFNLLEGGRFGRPGPLAGARVLDAFAGTGALGLEALSRGAAEAVFLEKAVTARRLLLQNLEGLGLAAKGRIIAGDALDPPTAPAPADLAFLDPPYRQDLALGAIAALDRRGWLASTVLLVLEVGAAEEIAPPPGFTLLHERRYGAGKLQFFARSTVG